MQLRLQSLCDFFFIVSPGLEQLRSRCKLHHRDSISRMNQRDDAQRHIPCDICVLQAKIVPHIKQQQDICRKSLHTLDLLGDTVLKHEHVIRFQRRIIMPKLIDSDDRQPYLFSENSNRFLLFSPGSRRRRRILRSQSRFLAMHSGRRKN